MKKIIFLSLIISTFIFIKCSGNSGDYLPPDNEYYAEKSYSQDPAYDTDDEINDNTNKSKQSNSEETFDIKEKIIKTANITIKVDNYDKYINDAKNIIKKFKAKIINENETSYYYEISNTIEIQVNYNLFDSLIQSLIKNKNVLSKEISAQDVTKEYIDVTARLKSKKLVRDKYSELLKKAKNIKEILEIQDKLQEIQEEIEVKQGELAYLNNKTKYSTINLTIKQENNNTEIYQPKFSSKIAKSFKSGWEGLKDILLGIIFLWPFWLILTIIYLLIRYFLKKRKAKKLNKKE